MDGQKKGGEGETRRGNRPTVVSRRSPSVRVGWYLDNTILTYVPVVLHMARKKGEEVGFGTASRVGDGREGEAIRLFSIWFPANPSLPPPPLQEGLSLNRGPVYKLDMKQVKKAERKFPFSKVWRRGCSKRTFFS